MQRIQTIPVTVFDGFFDDPDKVRAWALQQEYFSDSTGRWPGLRTKELFEVNEPFFQTTCKKFFSQFFELENVVEWQVSMRFQLVHKEYGSGWVHSDEDGSQLTGIVYLTPNPSLCGGTSVYRERVDLLQHVHKHEEHKKSFYLGTATKDEAAQFMEQHNSQFEETIRVSNVYNRLISFDSHLHHAAQDFFGDDHDSRLTLVIFVSKLLVNNSPVARVRRVT